MERYRTGRPLPRDFTVSQFESANARGRNGRAWSRKGSAKEEGRGVNRNFHSHNLKLAVQETWKWPRTPSTDPSFRGSRLHKFILDSSACVRQLFIRCLIYSSPGKKGPAYTRVGCITNGSWRGRSRNLSLPIWMITIRSRCFFLLFFFNSPSLIYPCRKSSRREKDSNLHINGRSLTLPSKRNGPLFVLRAPSLISNYCE